MKIVSNSDYLVLEKTEKNKITVDFFIKNNSKMFSVVYTNKEIIVIKNG